MTCKGEGIFLHQIHPLIFKSCSVCNGSGFDKNSTLYNELYKNNQNYYDNRNANNKNKNKKKCNKKVNNSTVDKPKKRC